MFDYRALYEIQLQVSVDFLRVVQFNWMCEGVASLDSEISVSVFDSRNHTGKEIRILDQHGNLKRSISLNEINTGAFMLPHYIAVSKTAVYVSETTEDFPSQVGCFTKHEVCKYKYAAPDLKRPVRMLANTEGQLLICNWQSDTRQLLREDGARGIDFLISQHGVYQPYSLSFRESDATLIVTFKVKR